MVTTEHKQRIHLLIRGKVQGVYYRSSACEEARVLGLTGFVRNLPTGEVELLAEGTQPVLDQLLAWCSQLCEWHELSRHRAKGGELFRGCLVLLLGVLH